MKSLNQAPTAINKASTDKILWEFSKEGKMSSHLGKIEKGFKELTFGLRLKMDELRIRRIWGRFKGTYQVEDAVRTKARRWEQNESCRRNSKDLV